MKNIFLKESNIILFLIFIITIIFILIMKFPSQNMTAEVTFSGGCDNLRTQLFFDLGEGYSEKNSCVEVIANNKAVIKIPNKYYKSTQIRFDPINSNRDIAIEKIKIFNYGKQLINWNALDISNHIKSSINIKEVQVIDDSVKIVAQNEDMQIVFNKEAIKEFQNAANYDFIIKVTLIIIIFSIFLIFLFRECINKKLRVLSGNLLNSNKFSIIVILLVIFVPVVVLYWKYLTFAKLYIFNDIGSDSYNQTFPDIIYNAKYIYKYHSIPMWSFNVGLGQNFFTQLLDPFNFILALFGENLVPYLLGVFQCVKVILAGGLFYKYLRTTGIARYVSIISALGYAFCGHIISRGSWVSYPNEVVCVAFILLSFELFYKKHNLKCLPIAVAFIIITLRGYYFFLYTGILVGYAIFRYLSENKLLVKPFIKYILCIVILYTIGILISSIYLIPNLLMNLNGATVSNLNFDFKNLIKNIFSINSSDILVTSYGRIVSQSIFGISSYSEYGNLLEAPIYYCGLITLIVIPQVFIDLDKRKKIWFSFALGMVMLYVFSPGIRYLVGGMATDQFKVSSFWVIVVLLYLSSYAFNEIVLGKKINVKLLTLTIFIILVPLGILYYMKLQSLVNTEAIKVVIFSLLYFVLLLGMKKYKYISKMSILLLTIVEVITFSYGIVNERGTVEKEYINNKGYYDSTIEVAKTINQKETDKFYRISKNYDSVFLCDSLIQGYYGTKSYQGGSSHSKYIVDFINEINVPLGLGSGKYIMGFGGEAQVNTLLAVKYILSNSDKNLEYGYDKLGKYSGITVLENKYSLPLGYAYSNYIKYDEFERLTSNQKKDILLKACVLNKDINTVNKLDISKYVINKENIRKENIVKQLDSYKSGDEIVINPSEKKDLITVNFSINSSEYFNKELTSNINSSQYVNRGLTGNIYWAAEGEEFNINKLITFGINPNNPKQTIEINQKDIKRIKIDINNPNNIKDIKINNIEISDISGENYYEEYRNNVSELNMNKFNITSFEQNKIQGNIAVNENKMMFFSIPYDKGWSLKVDGNLVKLENVNIGFMGAYITAGQHNIELKYIPSMLRISIISSVLGIIAYITMIIVVKKEVN